MKQRISPLCLDEWPPAASEPHVVRQRRVQAGLLGPGETTEEAGTVAAACRCVCCSVLSTYCKRQHFFRGRSVKVKSFLLKFLSAVGKSRQSVYELQCFKKDITSSWHTLAYSGTQWMSICGGIGNITSSITCRHHKTQGVNVFHSQVARVSSLLFARWTPSTTRLLQGQRWRSGGPVSWPSRATRAATTSLTFRDELRGILRCFIDELGILLVDSSCFIFSCCNPTNGNKNV